MDSNEQECLGCVAAHSGSVINNDLHTCNQSGQVSDRLSAGDAPNANLEHGGGKSMRPLDASYGPSNEQVAPLAKQGSPPKCPECGHNDMGRDGLCKESVPLIDKEPHGSRCCNCPCVNYGLRGAWWQADTAEKCVWAVDDVMGGDLWETACGAAFQFNDGGPEDNEFKFCYKCGKPIEAYRRSEDDDEDCCRYG